MVEIRHLENRHDVIFFCWGWSDLDKISQTCRLRWCVEMETRCRIPIWRTFGRIQCHVIPEPRITLQGAATWWIDCHDSRATCHIAGCSHLTKSMSWSCHIAGCKNSIRHIENRFSPYFIFFKCSLGFDERRLSYRLRYTCYCYYHINGEIKIYINTLTTYLQGRRATSVTSTLQKQ